MLKNITFTVESGDFVGIIGPNGSGKTTLLKCISGVLKPRVGRVLVGEDDVSAMARGEVGRTLAVVPQTSATDFTYTVFDMVMMGRTPHIGRFSSESRNDADVVGNAMNLTGTSALADRLYEELSGGEKQRVVIARALAQEPEILLLDEPTAHLDLGCQYEIMDLVKKLNADDRMTVIGVFHDLNLAAQYCRRVLLMNGGRVVSIGTPEDVLTPENIREAYCIDVLVKRHPLTGSAYVTPYYSKRYSGRDSGKTVHVVCGGGSGAPLMVLLLESGFRVTAGVLNVLDTDFDAAQALNVNAVSEAPFSQISDESRDKNVGLMEKADAIVVTDFPVGAGNLKNIDAVEKVAGSGKEIILVDSTSSGKRDFTGGKFAASFARLKETALTAKDNDDAARLVRKILNQGNASLVNDRKR